jgi:AcrR family transcriptional regulator
MEEDAVATAPGRRELRKQDRRDAIVRAARQSFMENGYAGTSMSGLLKTLGGSKATLWSYFRSKEDLFAAVVEEATADFQAELGDVLQSGAGLANELAGFCRTFLRKIESPDGVATWRMVVAASGRFPEVGRIFYERAVRLTEGKLVEYLERHVASGDLRAEDTAQMAGFIMGMCTARQNRLIWGVERGGDRALIDATAQRVTDLFRRAFAVDAG